MENVKLATRLRPTPAIDQVKIETTMLVGVDVLPPHQAEAHHRHDLKHDGAHHRAEPGERGGVHRRDDERRAGWPTMLHAQSADHADRDRLDRRG